MNDGLKILQDHLALKVDIKQIDFQKFSNYTVTKHFNKGEYFLRQGQAARYLAFLFKGVMCSYAIDNKGEKHVIQIAVEGHWISDLFSFLTREPANYYIEAMESTEVLLLSQENFDRACVEFPVFERYFRLLIQSAFINLQRRITHIYKDSAKDRYLRLIAEKPEIVHSVPQHYLASFLGIKPQSLSRIRSEIARSGR